MMVMHCGVYSVNGTCPRCGYCPTCGRANTPVIPWHPQPVYPPYYPIYTNADHAIAMLSGRTL